MLFCLGFGGQDSTNVKTTRVLAYLTRAGIARTVIKLICQDVINEITIDRRRLNCIVNLYKADSTT